MVADDMEGLAELPLESVGCDRIAVRDAGVAGDAAAESFSDFFSAVPERSVNIEKQMNISLHAHNYSDNDTKEQEITACPAGFLHLVEEWFKGAKRPLPWRDSEDPYRIWISEIMLQQTTVSAVIGYYERFVDRLPDVEALAACPDDILMKLWEGLGYYSRARNLKKAAVMLVESGEKTLPADYKKLLALPGIGPYTAGAIASMAFHLPYPAVDGNVLRVMARLTGSREDIMLPATRKIWEAALKEEMEAHPECDPAHISEGLMELGEVVCLPHGEVRCGDCPFNEICVALRDDLIGELPVRVLKTTRRLEKKTVLLIRITGKEPGGKPDERKILLKKRTEEGLLSGLYEFPNCPGHLSLKEAENVALSLVKEGTDDSGIQAKIVSSRRLPDARHLFSHIEWQMTGFEVVMNGEIQNKALIAAYPAEVSAIYAVPEAFKVYKRECLTGGSHEE